MGPESGCPKTNGRFLSPLWCKIYLSPMATYVAIQLSILTLPAFFFFFFSFMDHGSSFFVNKK